MVCMMFRELLVSMRPRQWYKNLVLFVGIVFSLKFSNPLMLSQVALAFVVFCMLSGGEYILNDVLDVEKDSKHPKKRNRPLACGRLNACRMDGEASRTDAAIAANWRPTCGVMG